MLTRQLGHGVGGNGIGLHVFVLGQGRCVAVGRGRSGKDHALYLGVARRHQHVDRAVDIGAVAAQRVEDGFRDGGNRRLVQDEVHAGAGFVHRVEVGNVGFAEVDAVLNVGEIFAFAGGEVVDAAHLLAAGKECARERRSDEAADASNQIESHAFSS